MKIWVEFEGFNIQEKFIDNFDNVDNFNANSKFIISIKENNSTKNTEKKIKRPDFSFLNKSLSIKQKEIIKINVLIAVFTSFSSENKIKEKPDIKFI